MSTTLHVITPGDPYVVGGTPTEVDLYCLDPNRNDAKVLAKIEKVVLHIEQTDPILVVEEVNVWIDNCIVVTKITNPCTTEITYAMEYVTDVMQAAICCLAAVPARPSPPDPELQRAWNFGSSLTDPYADLSSGSDTIAYTINGESDPGAMVVEVDTTSFEEDLFFVFREIKEQPDRHHYFNSDIIYGNIPDSIWRQTFEYGIYQYTITRIAATLDQNYKTTFTT